MILVTGPTGSGKSTTLHGMSSNHIATPDRISLTVEDPRLKYNCPRIVKPGYRSNPKGSGLDLLPAGSSGSILLGAGFPDFLIGWGEFRDLVGPGDLGPRRSRGTPMCFGPPPFCPILR